MRAIRNVGIAIWLAVAAAGCSTQPLSLSLTHVPATGCCEDLGGRVNGQVDISACRITVHLWVDGSWRCKPSEEHSLTAIGPDRTFAVDIATEPGDEAATRVVVCLVSVGYAPTCNQPPGPGEALATMETQRQPLARRSPPWGGWGSDFKVINFSPAFYRPLNEQPTPEQLRAMLRQLYREGYRGILTYDVAGCLQEIPCLARCAGFELVGVGVFNINEGDQADIDLAKGLRHLVDFYTVGNEGLFSGRYTKERLIDVMQEIRNDTGLPVTTAEPYDIWLANLDLFGEVDFASVNIYGWWAACDNPSATPSPFEPQQAVEFLTERYEEVCAAAGVTDVVIRETGYPTADHPQASPARQYEYFQRVEQASQVIFAYFEAYDQYWKPEDCSGYKVGAHWGLHDASGDYKWTDLDPDAPRIRFTFVPPLGTELNLQGVTENVDRWSYRVVAYIKVAGNWYVKPTYAEPLTPIGVGGLWACDITTGENDPQASEIRAYVVEAGYKAAGNALPAFGDYLTWTGATR